MKARQTDGVAAAAAKASFCTATGYVLEGAGPFPIPSKVRERRRPDPLATIFDAEVVPMLIAAPGLRAVGIFEELQRRHPGMTARVCSRWRRVMESLVTTNSIILLPKGFGIARRSRLSS